MSLNPIPTKYLADAYCPCDWKNLVNTHAETMTVVGLALAVAGVAAMVFVQSVGGVIGFALFGGTLFYTQCCQTGPTVVDLTRQMEQSEQQLQSRQAQVAEQTQKLVQLEQTIAQREQQFKQQLQSVQSQNKLLTATVATLQLVQKGFAQEKQSLMENNRQLNERAVQLQQNEQEFSQKMQTFFATTRELLPPINQISDASRELQASEGRFQQDVGTLNQKFDQDLSQLSKALAGWKAAGETTQREMEELRTLNAEAKKNSEQMQQVIAQVEQEFNTKTQQLVQQKEALLQASAQVAADQQKLDGLIEQYAKALLDQTTTPSQDASDT